MKKKYHLLLLCCIGMFLTFTAGAQALDPFFGSGGKAGPFANGFIPSQFDKAMIKDATGKILIAGSQNSRFAVMRVNIDGTPDDLFGINGVASPSGPGFVATAV